VKAKWKNFEKFTLKRGIILMERRIYIGPIILKTITDTFFLCLIRHLSLSGKAKVPMYLQ